MLDTAILVMQKESEFVKEYNKGMAKSEYWKPTLEDALNLLAKLPGIAAGVYRLRFKKGKRIPYKKDLDWDPAMGIGTLPHGDAVQMHHCNRIFEKM